MSKSYLLWAFIGMVGYSITALLVKLATQSGRFSSFFVLMIASAMVVATSTIITLLRGDMKAFSANNLTGSDDMFALGTGVALVIAVVFYFLALSEGPVSVVVPIFGMFIVGGAVLGVLFLHEPLTLRKGIGILLAAVSIILSPAIPSCDANWLVSTWLKDEANASLSENRDSSAALGMTKGTAAARSWVGRVLVAHRLDHWE
jgi:transporter family protein